MFTMIKNKQEFVKFLQKPLITDFLYMLLFGALSYVLGQIKLEISGINGINADLREIPLLISVFYIRKPLFFIGISLISSLTAVSGDFFYFSFFIHSISLVIIWYLFNYIKKKHLKSPGSIIIWFFLSVAYYLIFLIPLFIIKDRFFNHAIAEKNLYVFLIYSIRFEIISSSVVSTLYLLQLNAKKSIKDHMLILENRVKIRSKELSVINKKLTNTHVKLQDQKEELNLTLQNLERTQSKLIQSEKMATLGTLTAGVAQEIQKPLKDLNEGIRILSEINKYIPKELTDTYKTINRILSAGYERVSNIVKHLAVFISEEKPVLVPTNINKIIDNILVLQETESLSEINFVKEYKLIEDVPVYHEKIHQIILNIINNAVYAVNQEDAEMEKRITISTHMKNNIAFIQISNNGPKILEKNINKIFDPFFTTKEPGKGPGLGLSACYNLIKEHKGRISVKNNDIGVSFIIEIPIDKPKAYK